MSRTLKWMGFGFLFSLTFLFFLYRTFPYGQLKGRFLTAAEQAFGGDFRLEVGELAPSWFTGVELIDVTFSKVDASGHSLWLKAEEVSVRVGLISLLTGSPSASFAAQLGEGDIEGDITVEDDLTVVEIDFDEVPLSSLMLFSSMSGLQLEGRLDGECAIEANPSNVKATKGSLSLQLIDWRIKEGSKLKLGPMGEMELEESYTLAKGNTSGIDISIDRGQVRVDRLRLQGGDLQIDVNGQIFLETKVENSRLTIKGSVGLSDKLQKLVPVALLGPSNPDDGSFPFEVSGRFAQLRTKLGKLSF
jgi:type II secretion system protein N